MNPVINTKDYRLVEQKTKDNTKNLIKVTQKGKAMNYALYACKQLFNNQQDLVVIQGMGQASSKVISTVEFMRKRVSNLHVAYEIGSLESSRVYESLKQQSDRITTTKNIPYLSAHVTLTEGDKLKGMVGYMAPVPEGELLQQERFRSQIQQYQPRERPEVPEQQIHQQERQDQKPKHQYKKYKNQIHQNVNYGVKGQQSNPKGYQRTRQPKMTSDNNNNRNHNQGNRQRRNDNQNQGSNNRGGYRGGRGRGGRGRGSRGRGGRGNQNRNNYQN